jgi:hypothetical protein
MPETMFYTQKETSIITVPYIAISMLCDNKGGDNRSGK